MAEALPAETYGRERAAISRSARAARHDCDTAPRRQIRHEHLPVYMLYRGPYHESTAGRLVHDRQPTALIENAPSAISPAPVRTLPAAFPISTTVSLSGTDGRRAPIPRALSRA